MSNDGDPIWGELAHSMQTGSQLTQLRRPLRDLACLAEFLRGWNEREEARLTGWIVDHNIEDELLA